MTHVLDSRSTMSGFAKRTLTNHLFVSATQNKSQVHIVTQIITSMLGLLIFPQQYLCKLPGDATARTHFDSAIAKAKTEGWPDWRKWTFNPAMKKARDTEGNLDCLLKHLRKIRLRTTTLSSRPSSTSTAATPRRSP